MRGEDVLITLPTGAGKSRCFQLPAMLSAGLTVVIVPLLSLIADQLEGLSRHSIRALCLTSDMGREEAWAVYEELSRPAFEPRMLYVTPERLLHSVHLANVLRRLHACRRLTRIVVDECHCVVTWGRDFRPDCALREGRPRARSDVTRSSGSDPTAVGAPVGAPWERPWGRPPPGRPPPARPLRGARCRRLPAVHLLASAGRAA